MSTQEAFWRAIPFLEQIADGLTVEEARAEAERWKDSPDLNEAAMAELALEAAEILSLLNCPTCGHLIRRPGPGDGLDPDDFEWTHAEGGPVCDGPPVAHLGWGES